MGGVWKKVASFHPVTSPSCSSLQFTVPSLHSPLAVVLQQPCEDGEGEGERGVAHRLAQFLRGSLYLAVSALAQLEVQRGYKDYRQLPVLATNTLLLWQTLVQGEGRVCVGVWVWYKRVYLLHVLTPPTFRSLPQPGSCLCLPPSSSSPHTGTPLPGTLPPLPHPPLPQPHPAH